MFRPLYAPGSLVHWQRFPQAWKGQSVRAIQITSLGETRRDFGPATTAPVKTVALAARAE